MIQTIRSLLLRPASTTEFDLLATIGQDYNTCAESGQATTRLRAFTSEPRCSHSSARSR